MFNEQISSTLFIERHFLNRRSPSRRSKRAVFRIREEPAIEEIHCEIIGLFENFFQESNTDDLMCRSLVLKQEVFVRFDHLKKHPLIFLFSISLIFLTFFIQFQPSPFTVSAQSGGIRIREINPVVNEQNQITLTAIDASNQPVTNVVWESGSPEIASVDAQSGRVSGVRQGFATITARRGEASFSTFVVVTRVHSGRGAKVPGDTKTDVEGKIYLSDPLGSVILKKESFSLPADVFAGQRGATGSTNGNRREAKFNAPTAVAVNNSLRGGVFIADTANHSVRKIDFSDQVTTVLGNGAPGVMNADVTPFAAAVFRGLRGLAIDAGGNLFVADTENHAVYYADFVRQEVRLLAGSPGTSGKSDGTGRAARFFRPKGGAISPDGRLLAIVDEGNNVVRLLDRTGTVRTLSRKASQRPASDWPMPKQASTEILFDSPQAVSFDELGNLYVVDRTSAKVITQALTDQADVFDLAQPGSFSQAVSVVVRGTESFVLDANAATDDEAVKSVTVGGPEIITVAPDSVTINGGEEVILTGRNFAPESLLFFGETVISEFTVETATRIRFRVPPQIRPGVKTLTVRTRGGLAQSSLFTASPRLSELHSGEITTYAGSSVFIGDGGPAIAATLGEPKGLMVDPKGNLFFADVTNHRVRSVDPVLGQISTVAGTGVFGDGNPDGTDALAANLTEPSDVAIDSEGNLYTSDFQTILKVDAQTGKIQNLANVAGLRAFTLDARNQLFLVDVNCHCVSRLNPDSGQLTRIAGTGQNGFSGDGGPASAASLATPTDITVDQAGNLWIADSANHRIRRIDAQTGIISTVAGTGEGTFAGDGGPARTAPLNEPRGVALDSIGNLLIADTSNNRIRRVDARTGIISTVAGSNVQGGFSGDGGPATQAELSFPVAVGSDGAGSIYISDAGNQRIRKVSAATQTISTLAGRGDKDFGGEEIPAVRGRLFQPYGLVFDSQENLFIADTQVGRIRRLDRERQTLLTIAGRRTGEGIGNGGPAIDAFLSFPASLAMDGDFNLMVLDSQFSTLRQIVFVTGFIESVAGVGGFGFAGDGGPAQSAMLNQPQGIALDAAHNIYIADSENHRIRRIDAQTRIITTIAGTGTPGVSGDGGPARFAQLAFPTSLAFDSKGNLLIGDSGNQRIRRIEATTQTIRTVAGNGDLGSGGADGDGGPALQASFSNFLGGLAFDTSDRLYVSDTFLERVRRIDFSTGIITRVAGAGPVGQYGDGKSALTATLQAPQALAFDRAGNLYIADSFNNAVRVIKDAASGGGSQTQVTITGATYVKPNLTITGTGFGATENQVTINGKDVSRFIKTQSATSLALKGNLKKLNLQRGINRLAVTVNGVTSNLFELQIE